MNYAFEYNYFSKQNSVLLPNVLSYIKMRIYEVCIKWFDISTLMNVSQKTDTHQDIVTKKKDKSNYLYEYDHEQFVMELNHLILPLHGTDW